MTKANRLTWEEASRLLLAAIDAPPYRAEIAREILVEGSDLAAGLAEEGSTDGPGRVSRAAVEAARTVLVDGPSALGPHGRTP